MIEHFESIVREADALAVERCPMIIIHTDFTEKLRKLNRKVLVLHGDGDQGKSRPNMTTKADLQVRHASIGECSSD